MGGLESHSGETLKELLIIYSLVEVVTLDNARLKFFVLEEELADLLLNELWRNDLGFTAHGSTINKRIISRPAI
jgi:hypothetical protein